MQRSVRIRAAIFMVYAGIFASINPTPLPAQSSSSPKPDSYSANNRLPDPRFKVDILVVVAHPDDETMVTSYLAREIYDHAKRVAVVIGTRGNGGNNDVGPEQAASLADIREIEARQALGSLGITNVWFLGGSDTPSQNVLQSLETWDHGRALSRLIRIVRITRPSVILTFLPEFATGENHGDHQASGVLATEAFDLAGDPTVLSEQISPARDPDLNSNLTEALRPWQPQKIYFFSNPTHNIFDGQGPQYRSDEISPARHLSYGMLAAEAFTQHATQGGKTVERAIAGHTLSGLQEPIPLMEPVRLILGKSLVQSGVTNDVFTGVSPSFIPYRRAPGYTQVVHSEPVLELGDPWNFYHKFWQAHGLEHLANLVPPEISIHVAGTLILPLEIENPLDTPIHVAFSVQAPDGWTVKPTESATVAPLDRYYLRVRAVAPAAKSPGWQNVTVSAVSDGKNIGTVPIRVELTNNWVAPQ